MFTSSLHRMLSLSVVPVLLPLIVLFGGARHAGSPPIAVDDSFQVHGGTQLGNLLANDFDPDPGDSEDEVWLHRPGT